MFFLAEGERNNGILHSSSRSRSAKSRSARKPTYLYKKGGVGEDKCNEFHRNIKEVILRINNSKSFLDSSKVSNMAIKTDCR